MKILYFSSHPYLNLAAPSGPGTHMREVIKAFENRGHQVVKFIAGGEKMDASAPIVFKKNPIKKYIPAYFWQSLKDRQLLKFDESLFVQLNKFIQTEKPDLIYERGYYLMSSGVRAARENNLRHFIELNAPYPEEKTAMEGKSWFMSKADNIEKFQVENASLVVTVSSALKDYFLRRTKVTSDKILVTPNAVDAQVFHHAGGDVSAMRSRHGFEQHHLVIGFVGSIFPYHGVDELINAFVEIAKSRDHARLLVVGDGEILPQLKHALNSTGLAHKAVFTGNVPHKDVFDLICCMDITVMARSNWYGSPVKIFEYGAMKKLIIAPDEIPIHDVMEHGVNGFILGKNERALLPTLRHAIDHPEECQILANAFYSKVKNQHTWQHVGDSILEYCT
ncbi:MAG: glycosyltransferase family 4 protein [Flavobacteriales bacterium]